MFDNNEKWHLNTWHKESNILSKRAYSKIVGLKRLLIGIRIGILHLMVGRMIKSWDDISVATNLMITCLSCPKMKENTCEQPVYLYPMSLVLRQMLHFTWHGLTPACGMASASIFSDG